MTNLARWSDVEALSPRWADRARFCARMVPGGLRILDVGCGRMDVERIFRPSEYLPLDVVARDGRTTVVDLNVEPLPAALPARADLVTMLGVLEYIHAPDAVLRVIAAAGVPLLLSYCATDRHPNTDRRASDWVNDFTTDSLIRMLEGHGYEAVQLLVYEAEQVVILAAPKDRHPSWMTDRFHASGSSGRTRLVLAGFYGRGNCGDEALLQCVHETFAADYDIVISVDEHGAYKGFWDWYPYAKARIIHQVNLAECLRPGVAGLLVGGGGLPAGFAANQVISARSAGARTAFAGTDLWEAPPGDTGRWQQAVGNYLDLFDEVHVRQGLSLGCPGAASRPALFHGADWALKLPADQSPDIQVSPRRALVTIREFPVERVPQGYAREIAAMLNSIRDNGYDPVLLPFCPEDERFLTQVNLDRLAPVERHWWNPRRMKQMIASSGLMVSVGRLHPLVFAATTPVPVVSVRLDAGTGNVPRSKLLGMTAELGIREVTGRQGLDEFLENPLPADAAKVAMSKARLERMATSLRDLFASGTR